MKFGGSSLKDGSSRRRAADLVAVQYRAGHQVVMVVSAPGNTTDELIAQAEAIQAEPDERSLALLLAVGEQQSCALVAMELNARRIPAVPMAGWQAGIRTDGANFVGARIAGIDAKPIHRCLDEGSVVVVAGFQGLFVQGGNRMEVAVLERGGSDTTAIHLACALGADKCVLFKDVDGIASASPNIVPGAPILDTLSLEELREMARGGAGVVSGIALQMLWDAGLVLSVRSTFTDGPGTSITLTPQHERVVSSITLRQDVALIIFELLSEHRDTPFLQAFAREDININLAEGNSQTIRGTDALKAAALLGREQEALGIRTFEVRTNLAQITVVGEGMRNTPGVLGQIQEVLEKNGIEWFLRSTSEIAASYIVREEDCQRAIEALHLCFFGGVGNSPHS